MSILITVLLTILKILGILLLVLLALILTALLIPVGAQVIFEGGKLTVRAKAGPVSLTVYPWRAGKKKKPEKPKKSAEAKPVKKQKTRSEPEKSAAPAREQPKPEAQPKSEPKPAAPQQTEHPKPKQPERPPKKPAKKPAKKKAASGSSGGTLGGLPWGRITSALELLPTVLKKLFGSIRIHDIRLVVPVHKRDAAATAIWYGRVNGLIGGAVAAASHIFQVELKELNVLCDYTNDAAGKEHFSCKITTHLMQLAVLGITTLIQLKKRKII